MKELSNTDLLAVLVGRESAAALSARPLAKLFGFRKPNQMQLCEERASYIAHPALGAAKELFVRCLQEQMQDEGICLSSPQIVKGFLCSEIGHLEYESFWCLWLDAQNRLIHAGEMFRGTVTQTSVYPREIVKMALSVNAVSVIFAHNHPSGVAQPSRADEMLTQALKSALALVDIKVFDHFIITENRALSFAEKGLL